MLEEPPDLDPLRLSPDPVPPFDPPLDAPLELVVVEDVPGIGARAS